MELTPTQKKFIELDKEKSKFKEILEDYKTTVEKLVDEMDISGHFQDEDGTVYQVDACDGKFVYFDRFEVKRTRRTDETRGSLSLKKARELGYEIE